MTESLTARRARLLGPGVPTFYAAPVHLVAGEGVWVRDAGGRRYLDAYNNVPHVGHGHPRVVEAVARQLATLNTHSRYLHDAILDHAERLTARLGHGLGQVLYVCTGSEANDVALRMAQAATGRMGLIATDAGYHGNTALVSAVTASRTPIGGRPAFVRLVPAPDRAEAATPAGFAAGVQAAIDDLAAGGHGLAAMILCPFQANEGFPDLPAGFFAPAAAAVRAAGGLLVADEVQPGFGRLGSHLWAHDRAGLVPDIVTLGKPMGNGYPVAAVVAGPGPMAAFRDRFRYFNTFGASPVAAAAALATLAVLEEEGLQARAAATGDGLRAALAAAVPPALATVRGTGLFLGLAFRSPALARAVVEGLCGEGVLAGLAGRDDEVLKIRPPMPFGSEHAGILLAALGRVLARLDPRP